MPISNLTHNPRIGDAKLTVLPGGQAWLDQFAIQTAADGTVTFRHSSGSRLVFNANGDIQLVPQRDLSVDPGRMVRIATSEDEALAFYRFRLLQTLQAALNHKQGGDRGFACC